MKIAEPITTLTDYLLAAVVLVFTADLVQSLRFQPQVSRWMFALGFVAVTVAAVLGGTSHGFGPRMETRVRAIVWRGALYTIGLSSLLLLVAVIIASTPPPLRNLSLLAATAKFLLFTAWLIRHDQFRYVAYDYGTSLLAALALEGVVLLSGGDSAAPWLVAGISVSFLAVAVQRSGLTLHRHFNHNDLYHIIQLGAMYLLYRGGLLLVDR